MTHFAQCLRDGLDVRMKVFVMKNTAFKSSLKFASTVSCWVTHPQSSREKDPNLYLKS